MPLNYSRNLLVTSIKFKHDILCRRYQRNIRNKQRIQQRGIIIRANTSSRIPQMPPQITNDQFASQVFNGSSFY